MNGTSVKFSIVIATYNRPVQLATCLQSLSMLDYPRDQFEVIVVDDGGSAALDGIVAAHREALDISLMKAPHGGPGRARNFGAWYARGRFLAFTDDDCAPAPNWLRVFDRHLEAIDGPLLVGGWTRNRLLDNAYSTASQVLLEFLYGYFEGRRGRFFTTNNAALSREAFQQLGGFDETIPVPAGEDRDFCVRWGERGLPMKYAADAIVEHFHNLTFKKFWRQHFTYGRAAYHFRLRQEARSRTPSRVEPLFFYSSLVCYPLAGRRVERSLAVSVLLGMSQVATVAGCLYEGAMSRGVRSQPFGEPQC